MRLKAYAKINLGLKILGKRQDGYHDIESILLPINFFDEIEISSAGVVHVESPVAGGELSQHVEFISNAPPYGRENLCVRAADAFLRYAEIGAGVEIRLTKQVWMGAGLGGGSSCAGCVLTGMNTIFGTPLTQEELLDIGLAIGSDVPFFINGGPAVVEGRGEIMTRLPSLPGEVWFVLVYPGFSVSTKWAYENMRNYLTSETWDFTVLRQLFLKGNIGDMAQNLRNDFEDLLFDNYPELRGIKERLLELGAWGSSVSGSGSCVYGIFEKPDGKIRGLFPNCEVEIVSSRVV